MTNPHTPPYHTVEDEWLAAYCAGGLSMAKRLVLACQAAINPALARRIDKLETVGGVLLESSRGEAVSDNFMMQIFARIDEGAAIEQPGAAPENTDKAPAWAPAPLLDFFKRAEKPMAWKNMGFGVERMPIHNDGGEKLYLLKSRPGLKMPHHSHKGEEWALILQGGYHVGETGFVYGDLHREDETCAHQPVIDDHGQACITLVAAEGGLTFTNPALNLFRPLLGV